MDSVGVNNDPEKDAKYYELFVLALVVLFFAVLTVRHFAAIGRTYAARRLRVAYSDMNGGLKTALQMFKADCGRYPTTDEGWSALINPPKDGSLTNWHGPYLDLAAAPEDPWGHPYVYRFPGIHNRNSYDLSSVGLERVSKRGGGYDDGERLRRDINELLLIIPVLFGFRVVAGISSREFRAIALQNRMVDWLWFAISIIAFWIVFLMPRISG